MRLKFGVRGLLVWLVVLVGVGQWALYSGDGWEKFESAFTEKVFEVYRAGGEQGLREFVRRYHQVLDERIIVSLLKGWGITLNEEQLEIALVLVQENGNELLLACVYLLIGKWHRRNDNSSECVEYWKKAIPFFERSRYPNKEAYVQLLRARIAWIGREPGLKGLQRAVDQTLSIPQFSDDEYFKGIRYLLDGYFAQHSGDVRKMFANYELARECFQKSGDFEFLGIVELYIAEIYKHHNMFLKALSFYDRALAHFKKTNDFEWRIKIYLEKACCYGLIGKLVDLDRLLACALELARKKGEEIWIARIYHQMGHWWVTRNQIQKARALLDRAESIFSSKGYLTGLAHVLISKASISASEKNYSAALSVLKSISERLEREYGTRHWVLYWLYQFIAQHYLSMGDNEHALEYLQRMKFCVVHGWDFKYPGFYTLLLGDAFARSGKKKEALNFVQKAMTNIEKYRAKLFLQSMQQGIGQDNFYLYTMAAAMMFENQEYERGFEMLERLRARVFLDRLAEGLVPLEKGVDQKLLDKRSRLLGKLSMREKELHELAPESEARHSKRLKEDVQALENELEDLTSDMRLKSPVYSAIQYPRPVSVKELQANILNDRETMVQFFCFKNVALAIVLSREDFKIVSLEITEGKLSQLINSYRWSLKSGGGGQTIEGRRFAHLLYKKLFQPLEKYLDKTKDLIVVPDGRLALLPFESLIVNRKGENGRPMFLIDNFSIKYVQSASVLAILRRHYQRNRKTNRFVGFGDPVYDYESFSRDLAEKDFPDGSSSHEVEEILQGKYDGAGGCYNRLKGTGDEVRAIAAIFDKLDGGDAIVRLRDKAVEEEVKSAAMKDYDYIHLACHSLLSDGFQSLVLSQDVPKHTEDGYLTLNEVMNCDFNAKLVVLSACNTGGGSLERGEGVTGLTRAIMYAGTPAVVASLWAVDDNSAKELMIRFYDNLLKRKMSRAEALRQAKISMLNSEMYSSPRHWSAFVMYGE